MLEHPVRLAALADLHCDRNCQGSLNTLFGALAERADVVLLCGDLTHHGTPEEGAVLARELAPVRVPVIAVLGNHDHQSGQVADLTRMLGDAGVHVLDGDPFEIHGIGFAGVKGFCGGFGPRALESWGEEMIKRFVHEAVEEALKLESALSRLSSEVRVVLTHYAPIADTVAGEPPEIFPFMGSSRLEEPLNRYHVVAAFHGHAHHGTPEGRTSTGVPVYNVSMSLMHALQPDRLPVRLVEIEVPKPRVPAIDDAPVTRLPVPGTTPAPNGPAAGPATFTGTADARRRPGEPTRH
jgi:Icc-related predicted phosphoesterase